MIVIARYVGPFFEVTVPGWEYKTSQRGADGQHPEVCFRIQDYQVLSDCWQTTKVTGDEDVENVADLPDAGGDMASDHEDGER